MLVKFLMLAVFLVPSAFLLHQPPTQDDPETNSFIGVEACATCHKTEKQGKQLEIWKNSKHSRAYQTLLTEQADKIAEELGHSTLAAETEECLKCHASGYNVDPQFLGAKFKIEDGVQCETCHGAGSNYKSISVMKNREEAVAKGLILHDNIEDYCISCHNPESPTFVEIDFGEQWQKIRHDVPKKE